MRIILLLLVWGLLISGCSGIYTSSVPGGKEKVSGSGRIIYVEQGGGFYAIKGPGRRHFYPLNLPPDLKKRGKRIRFSGTVEKDVVGLEEWGEYLLLEHVE